MTAGHLILGVILFAAVIILLALWFIAVAAKSGR